MSAAAAARAALAAHVRGATDAQLTGSLDALALELDLVRLAGGVPDTAKVRAKIELSCEHARRVRESAAQRSSADIAADVRGHMARPYAAMNASERNELGTLQNALWDRFPDAERAVTEWVDAMPDRGASLPEDAYMCRFLDEAGL